MYFSLYDRRNNSYIEFYKKRAKEISYVNQAQVWAGRVRRIDVTDLRSVTSTFVILCMLAKAMCSLGVGVLGFLVRINSPHLYIAYIL